jgi:hypothetical protein
MDKLQSIQELLLDTKLREALAEIVADVDALTPQSEEEFMELQKFGLYSAEECIPFVTVQGTPFYQLDNMAMVPKREPSCYLHYGDYEFRQLEVLYMMARMDSIEAQQWLKDNLLQGCRHGIPHGKSCHRSSLLPLRAEHSTMSSCPRSTCSPPKWCRCANPRHE